MKKFLAHSASLVLLISFLRGVAIAIRTLKEGPMIDADGREYKTASLTEDSSPRASDSVRVECTEVSMIVYIQADFYRTGRLVSPGDLFLGGAEHKQDSRCRAVVSGHNEYVIEAGLQDCGSKLTITDDDVIYSNKLVFSPVSNHHTITRMTDAIVPVSCHYKRTHTVSSSNTEQAPMTFSQSAKFSTKNSAFSLKLMADDWLTEMLSSKFHLGDFLRFEAKYTGPEPRQLFVESCVATLTPDATSVPRYYFIENHGCFTDSKAGSVASFLPRSRANLLQFQIDAFLFRNDLRNTIYITCNLKATLQMRTTLTDKACNYVHSSWKSVDENDSVCWCCDSICYQSLPRDDDLCDIVTLGPLRIISNK
ncbi:ZPC domain containing protein 3 precursor [Oryzias latipes]|uniref:Zona pellucida sperm-binding protein 3 n=1 Tax=Oryzias latipes TaxID=8090 RepID=Q9W7E0_ORYLA|nr:ZPC domain containing protein 3 precursor [Oryzias latipes]AAD38908.1 ZPC domain containing protein 3 [Oryzias latipes]